MSEPKGARLVIDGPELHIPDGAHVVIAGTGALSRYLSDVGVRRGRRVDGPATAQTYLSKAGYGTDALRTGSESDLIGAGRQICGASEADWVILNATEWASAKAGVFVSPKATVSGRSITVNCGNAAATIQKLTITARFPIVVETMEQIAADWGAELFPR